MRGEAKRRRSQVVDEISDMDAAACALPSLDEDAVSEILARVADLVSLFRCAVVCKRWRRLVSDLASLRRRPSSSLLGFFVQRHKIQRPKAWRRWPSLAPVLVPAPGSALGPGRRFLSSFVRDDAGVLDQARLASRGSLVLVRVPPHAGDSTTLLRLCMCDLVSGKLDLLPPLDHVVDISGYAVLAAADHVAGPPQPPADGYSALFQVQLIGFHRSRRSWCILMFSPAAASRPWSCTHLRNGRWASFGCPYAVVTAPGTARWLFHYSGNLHRPPGLYTVDVSVFRSVSESKLPLGFDMMLQKEIPPSSTYNCNVCLLAPSAADETRLSLAYLDDNHLSVLTTEKGGDDLMMGGSGAIKVGGGMDRGLLGVESLSIVCPAERSAALLVVYYSDPDSAYLLDLQSGSMTKLEGWRRTLNFMTAVASEIDCLDFFRSRLGGVHQ